MARLDDAGVRARPPAAAAVGCTQQLGEHRMGHQVVSGEPCRQWRFRPQDAGGTDACAARVEGIGARRQRHFSGRDTHGESEMMQARCTLLRIELCHERAPAAFIHWVRAGQPSARCQQQRGIDGETFAQPGLHQLQPLLQHAVELRPRSAFILHP